MEEVKISEFIDRLIDSDFNFRIEDNKIITKSSPSRETNDSILGFHSWGRIKEYYCVLNGFDASDIIYDAFNTYKGYLKRFLEQKLERIIKNI